MMATPSFPFKRTRNFLHSCLFLFSLETVSTVWNRGLRCPSTTSRQSSFSDVSLRCAILAVSSKVWVSYSAHQFQPWLWVSEVSDVLLGSLVSTWWRDVCPVRWKSCCSAEVYCCHLDQLSVVDRKFLLQPFSVKSHSSTSSPASILRDKPGPSLKILSPRSVRNKIASDSFELCES